MISMANNYAHYQLYLPFEYFTDEVKLKMRAVLEEYKVRSECMLCCQIGNNYTFVISFGKNWKRAEQFEKSMGAALNRENWPLISKQDPLSDITWNAIKQHETKIACPL